MADAFCETKSFVRNIYRSIKTFAQNAGEHDGFIEDWVETAYNEEWGEMDDTDPRIKDIFLNKVSSVEIEKFLSDENSTVRFIPVKLK